jgi:uncharacterized SAM-binding protein YcdF (DUF218 family)
MPRRVGEDWREYLGPGAVSSFALAGLTALVGLGIPLAFRLREVLRTAGLDERHPTDVILILGRTLDGDGITEVFRGRLDHGLALLAAGVAPRILITGGLTGRASRTEAAAGREYLLSRGLEPEQILVEDRSRNTLENLYNVRQRLRGEGLGSLVLVSDALHLARAAALARGFSLAVQCSAAPLSPPFRGSLHWWGRAAREAALLHWYRVGVAYSKAIGSHRLLSRVT